MAGDWLPIRLDLHDDPAVIAVAAACGLDEFGVVGRLLKLWGWANAHTTDGNAQGNARGVTETWVDRYSGVSGFASAMLAAGWLAAVPDAPGAVCFPNFDRWNSQGAKKRLLTSRRVAKHKATANAQGNAQGNGVGSAPGNAASVSDALPKGEKRRDKEKTPQPPEPGTVLATIPPVEPAAIPLGILDTPAFREAWASWMRNKPGAKLKPESQSRQIGKLQEIGPDAAVKCIEHSLMNQYQGLFPEKFAAQGVSRPNLFLDNAGKAEARAVAQVAARLARIPQSDPR